MTEHYKCEDFVYGYSLPDEHNNDFNSELDKIKMENIYAKQMDDKFKNIINEAYVAWMNKTATDEQELIWRLANAIHCTRTRWMINDIEIAKKILYEHDYTI